MPNRVAIVDHGLSNLNSITRAIEECDGQPFVTRDPRTLRQASRIVLPGVGAFPAAADCLRRADLFEALRVEVARRAVPLLGICLGMQLLADSSSEGGNNNGLGLLPGRVLRLTAAAGERIPHMGWNELRLAGDHPLFEGIADGTDFYFVHSYSLVCDDAYVLGRTPYCGGFVAAAAHGPVMAVQFHPEKSQKAGFRLLRNFLAL